MFTEGLDPHEIQWIQERTDQVQCVVNEGLDFAIPPLEELGSGHLPDNAAPLSRTIPVGVSSDLEEEICGSKNSSDSSPPQNIHSQRDIPDAANGVARLHHHGSDDHSSLSSSMDAVGKSVGQQWKNGRMSDSTNEEEEGLSEACGSSSFLWRMGCVEGIAVREGARGGYAADSYSTKNQHQGSMAASVDKGLPVDAASTPLFHGSLHEINQAIDPVTNLNSCDTLHTAAFNIYSTQHCTSSRQNSGSKIANQDIRSPTVGIETAPSKFFLKVPTFHACTVNTGLGIL